MFLLLIWLLLALVPLLGIAGIVIYGSITTVDGLFMSLILLAISGLFGTVALFELRKGIPKNVSTARTAAGTSLPVPSGAGLVQRGKIDSVQFFESHVGQPAKSLVVLSDRAPAASTLVFDGDMRNALPVGQRVEVTFRKSGLSNVLVSVSYS
jgi:hypothetical protein